jgi:phosphoribosylglycinamide formyltransferase-1
MMKARVAVLISGRGSNLAALVEAAKRRSYPAEIALVLSNRPAAAGLSHAQAASVPTGVIDHVPYHGDRERFEHAIEEVLERYRIDIVCLAGFMRVLTASFIKRWEGRMLNVHPSLLPAFKGLDTHGRALAAGVKVHGATIHFVAAGVDDGPIVAQGALAVHDQDTPETLANRVLEIEHRIYPMALGLLAAGRLELREGRCVIGRQTTDDRGQTTGTVIISPLISDL